MGFGHFFEELTNTTLPCTHFTFHGHMQTLNLHLGQTGSLGTSPSRGGNSGRQILTHFEQVLGEESMTDLSFLGNF